MMCIDSRALLCIRAMWPRLLAMAIAPGYCAWLLPLAHPLSTLSQSPTRLVQATVTFKEEIQMPNPLDSLWGTVITGVIVTVVLYYVAVWLMGA